MLLLCALCALWPAAAHGAEDTVFSLDGHIRHFAATPDAVFVATEQSLYQLSPDLTLVRRVSQKGVLVRGTQTEDAKFVRVPERSAWNVTFSVNVLLPFVANNSLVLCGVLDNDYCEVLGLQDVSTVIYTEHVLLGPERHHNASVSFFVSVEGETYILAARGPNMVATEKTCSMNANIIFLYSTNDKQPGSIFSYNDLHSTPCLNIRENRCVGFVDGFQVDSVIYLFSEVSSDSAKAVRLLWFEAKGGKEKTIKSLRGATLGEGARASLLASSVITGTAPLTWSGVFSVDGSRASTELLLFDISPDFRPDPVQDQDPDFCTCNSKAGAQTQKTPKTLEPLKVLLKQSYMSSVLALKHKAWLLFFIGTTDGQLIKLVVDKNYHTLCPKVLYRADDDRKAFPNIHVDEDRKHVYVAFTNQIMRIPVSKCSTYTSVHDCWSAQDPLCVWCDSTQSCVFESDCKNSSRLSTSEDFQQEKVVSHKTESNTDGQITLKVRTHVTVGLEAPNNYACHFSLQCSTGPRPRFPQCTCILSNYTLPAQGLEVTVKIRLWNTSWSEKVKLMKCPDIRGPPSPALCRECLAAGCGWSSSGCSWANNASTNKSVCQLLGSDKNYMKPEITSVQPSVVSFYGRNHALLTGRNLSHVTRVRIQADMDCSPQESPVWSNTGVNLTFHIPSAKNKGVVKVCAVLPDGSCHSNATITYRSLPTCPAIKPSNTWLSGGRTITLVGSHMEFVEAVVHSHAPHVTHPFQTITSQNLTYATVPAEKPLTSKLYLRVANETLNCSMMITYHPNPEFTSYNSIKTGGDATITIQKKVDKLDIRIEELSVWAVGQGKEYPCISETRQTETNETDFYTCEIKNTPNAEFEHLMIKFGETTIMLKPKSSYFFLILLVLLLLIPCITVVVVIFYRKKQNKLTTRMNRKMENLEMDIRNHIRQGFIDLQTEKANLLENVGTIPFLDYQHFASKIFFPESDLLMKSCINDIGQDRVMVQLDECCQGLSKLIRDQLFLTSMVHALEEQKNFSIKDKCVVASVLTVALHSDLWYLTELMETLLRDLMRQGTNTQPKMLLRRTESIVEKLLTNWMSICLYGFLRESVGQHLFLMVSALTQQISKGPVDCVTEKALYTLSEDWLLWEAQDFEPLKLKVLFVVGSDGELSEPLEVDALTCDTVDQVKEKILSTFRAKFGFPYNIPIRDVCIEYVRNTASLRLEEVDASSEVMGEVTKLNTMKHYKIPDGATIKVLSLKSHPPLSAQRSVKDDQDFCGKYFHLIDPDVVEDQKSPERKKLKLREVHLTKLLSTKVAVHSFVENLFRCIWGMQQNRPPLVVKYFFDFLDAQAEDMKVTDPDVLHIWKTNSLPLRFWVNILKNPQFVFDLEKSPHVDGCLSVIAQAFMDSFSLTDMQLGKHTPTNKLLYAKEIPKFKQEVKVYYKQIQEQPPVTEAEFKAFLQIESKKHENEFNEATALKELYKFIHKYFTEIQEKLDQNGAPSELKEQLHHVKNLFDGLKSCSWN